MKIFHCPRCQHIAFFENVACTVCGAELGFDVSARRLTLVERDGREPTRVLAGPERRPMRLCENGLKHQACNWLVDPDDPHDHCLSCRLTEVIPDLEDPAHNQAWRKLEAAKRRLLYSIQRFSLPVDASRAGADDALRFRFMASTEDEPVHTGHASGVITVNVAEADTPYRERMREDMGEAYRTLLGHLRHESGHYYWDRILRGTEWLEPFRAMFGDERADYAEALQRHYADGPIQAWEGRHVSAYASMHPWEDWAETWAHYLHMIDTLETARSYGLGVSARRVGELSATEVDFTDFDDVAESWIPLTLALNSLNRSMGQADSYPFVLSESVLEKLRFVHALVHASRGR